MERGSTVFRPECGESSKRGSTVCVEESTKRGSTVLRPEYGESTKQGSSVLHVFCVWKGPLREVPLYCAQSKFLGVQMANKTAGSSLKKNESLNYAIEHGAHGLHKSQSYVSVGSQNVVSAFLILLFAFNNYDIDDIATSRSFKNGGIHKIQHL